MNEVNWPIFNTRFCFVLQKSHIIHSFCGRKLVFFLTCLRYSFKFWKKFDYVNRNKPIFTLRYDSFVGFSRKLLNVYLFRRFLNGFLFFFLWKDGLNWKNIRRRLWIVTPTIWTNGRRPKRVPLTLRRRATVTRLWRGLAARRRSKEPWPAAAKVKNWSFPENFYSFFTFFFR